MLPAAFLALLLGQADAPMPLAEAMKTLDDRPAWTELPPTSYPRHPAEKYLEDMTIVLDPGHGGQAHRKGYKRGPTGVREAEMNWRVAKLAEKLLTDAGAKVILTRDGDVDVSLAERARIANEASRPDGGKGADLFVSLHHNAGGGESANYTTVWFHGPPSECEVGLDVAKYLAHSVARALRTQVGRTSPLMNDRQMYEGGFGVLRPCAVPAVLIEASFFSHPEEEQRLRDAAYNLREAYAIYEALCEYAYGGRPTQSEPQASRDGDELVVTCTLDDGLPEGWWGHELPRTIASSVTATLDGRPMRIDYDPATNVCTARLRIAAAGGAFELHHVNLFKHHNWPQRYELDGQ